MIAGPSEVLVYAEGEAQDRADWLAMDLLSQAEHDRIAQAIFVTTSEDQLKEVAMEIEKHWLSCQKQISHAIRYRTAVRLF